jgi:hypothetical protein
MQKGWHKGFHLNINLNYKISNTLKKYFYFVKYVITTKLDYVAYGKCTLQVWERMRGRM